MIYQFNFFSERDVFVLNFTWIVGIIVGFITLGSVATSGVFL